ncbi:MAG: tetratricopeptide repeat protein [Melioribacteraceae bacterium]|nr:tetratricopeptide repeat protein [Melioribacteraceae bacterium]
MSIYDLFKNSKPTPLNYADLVNDGVRMASAGDIHKAINNYKEAINLDPTREEAYANLANAYDDLNDYENAIAIYEKCIEINPTNPNHYFNLGIIYNNFRNKSALNIFDLDQPIGQVSENEENSNACFLMATYLGDEEAKRFLETREIVVSSKGKIERKKPNLSTKLGIIKDLILIAQYKIEWGFYRSAKKIFTYVLSVDKSNKDAITGINACENYDEDMDTAPSETNNSFKKFVADLNTLSLTKKYRCDVYKETDQKLINNEKGFIRIQNDIVTLETDDESGDKILFYPKEDKLFCKYVVMNGRIMVDETFKSVEFQMVEFPNTKLNIEVQNDDGDLEVYF